MFGVLLILGMFGSGFDDASDRADLFPLAESSNLTSYGLD